MDSREKKLKHPETVAKEGEVHSDERLEEATSNWLEEIALPNFICKW